MVCVCGACAACVQRGCTTLSPFCLSAWLCSSRSADWTYKPCCMPIISIRRKRVLCPASWFSCRHLKASAPDAAPQLTVSVLVRHPTLGAYFDAHLLLKECPEQQQCPAELGGYSSLFR